MHTVKRRKSYCVKQSKKAPVPHNGEANPLFPPYPPHRSEKATLTVLASGSLGSNLKGVSF